MIMIKMKENLLEFHIVFVIDEDEMNCVRIAMQQKRIDNSRTFSIECWMYEWFSHIVGH